MEDLRTGYSITWCPGCTNFGIYTTFMTAINELISENKIEKIKLYLLQGLVVQEKYIIILSWVLLAHYMEEH